METKRANAESAAANRVNTMPAIMALVKSMGGSFRQASKIMGANYSTLWRQKEGKKNCPSLDALVLYANRVYARTGIKMVVTVTPDMSLYYTLTDSHDESSFG
jgi:hypothetical protein